jgi:predicted O-methyltransferase YrrM
LKYLLFSGHRNGHGIHSPFVYQLVSGVFRNKIDPHIVLSIEKTRKRLMADKRTIIIEDLGAGSERMKSDRRKVSDIAKYSAVPRKYGILLASMAETFGNPYILEFGTSFGISTMYMASAFGGKIITMEGCREVSEIARENFMDKSLENITILNGSFDSLLPEIKRKHTSPGLVFIDGNHRKMPTLNYFSSIAGLSDENCVVIIDDIYSSPEMEEAWFEIKNHESVTLTIDIYRMGIVFFRKGIARSNYIVRY